MRKYVILLIVLSFAFGNSLRAQHYLGVSAGYGVGSIRLLPKEETSMLMGLYSGGLTYKYYFNPKYVGGIGADFLFMQQGFIRDVPIESDSTRKYSRSVNSVMVPLFWQPHINLFRGHMRFFVNLGLTFSMNLTSHYKIESEISGLVEEGPYDMQLVRDNRVGYGLCGGAGINVAAGHFEMSLEGRYYYGYSDILRNKTKYMDNPLRSPLDNINISMALYYRFGESVIVKKAPKAPKIKKQKNKNNGDNTPTESSAPNTEGR